MLGRDIHVWTTQFLQVPGVLENLLEYVCGVEDASWFLIASLLDRNREEKLQMGVSRERSELCQIGSYSKQEGLLGSIQTLHGGCIL